MGAGDRAPTPQPATSMPLHALDQAGPCCKLTHHRQLFVHTTLVLGEPVEDASGGVSVEKCQGRVQDPLHHCVVHSCARAQHAPEEEQAAAGARHKQGMMSWGCEAHPERASPHGVHVTRSSAHPSPATHLRTMLMSSTPTARMAYPHTQ